MVYFRAKFNLHLTFIVTNVWLEQTMKMSRKLSCNGSYMRFSFFHLHQSSSVALALGSGVFGAAVGVSI